MKQKINNIPPGKVFTLLFDDFKYLKLQDNRILILDTLKFLEGDAFFTTEAEIIGEFSLPTNQICKDLFNLTLEKLQKKFFEVYSSKFEKKDEYLEQNKIVAVFCHPYLDLNIKAWLGTFDELETETIKL